jgi:hypothetical protein
MRFGPSGSLLNRKITREQTIDAMPKRISVDFFDLKRIVANIYIVLELVDTVAAIK